MGQSHLNFEKSGIISTLISAPFSALAHGHNGQRRELQKWVFKEVNSRNCPSPLCHNPRKKPEPSSSALFAWPLSTVLNSSSLSAPLKEKGGDNRSKFFHFSRQNQKLELKSFCMHLSKEALFPVIMAQRIPNPLLPNPFCITGINSSFKTTLLNSKREH